MNLSIADALMTRSQQTVLGLLFGQPDRSFYTAEIIAHANMGTGTVRRELERLEQAGVIQSWRVGHQKHVQANRNSPVFEPLYQLILRTVGFVAPLQQALTALPDHAQQIQQAWVFGSIAKGQASAKSDIDLCVISDTLSLFDVLTALEPAAQRLGRPINPVLWTRAELNQRLQSAQAFATRMLAGPTILLAGPADDFRELQRTAESAQNRAAEG